MAFNKCRFCENDNIQFVSYEGPFGPKYQIICNKCKNSTAQYLCKDDAFSAWNKENREDQLWQIGEELKVLKLHYRKQ